MMIKENKPNKVGRKGWKTYQQGKLSLNNDFERVSYLQVKKSPRIVYHLEIQNTDLTTRGNIPYRMEDQGQIIILKGTLQRTLSRGKRRKKGEEKEKRRCN